LRLIALGVSNYETAFNKLPMGSHRADDPQWPSRTWLAEILPYVEERAVYDESVRMFRLGVSPFSHATHQQPVKLYGCPGDGRSGTAQWTHGPRLVALTSYIGVFGTDRTQPTGVLIFDQAIRAGEISDGLSHTLMIGERPPSPDNWYGWWYAGLGQDGSGNPEMIMGVRETNLQVQYAEDCPVGPYHFEKGHFDQMCDVFHFWSPHSGGANFAFCDASIKFLPYEADGIIEAMATRAGREVVTLD
jgi:prepilin-type processing-associated H-X9-DG protein